MRAPTVKAVAATAIFALAVPASALAQAGFPLKPVRLINPFAPGGPVDIVGRTVAQELSTIWGQPVIVDNRPGAGTTLGAALVARATPDGYTLLVTSVSTAVASTVYRNLPYDAAKDFAPLTLAGSTPLALMVHPSLPVRDVRELLDHVKKNPGQLSYASGGNGTSQHLTMELLKTMTGTFMVHIPYKGAGRR